MPTEQSEITVALIVEAYRQSGMKQVEFGAFLKAIAADFIKGKAHQPYQTN